MICRYVQGMSYLAAMLLLSLDTYQAFVALANLLHGYPPPFFFNIYTFVFILITSSTGTAIFVLFCACRSLRWTCARSGCSKLKWNAVN